MLSVKYVIIFSVKSQNCDKIPIYIIIPSAFQTHIKSQAEEGIDRWTLLSITQQVCE